jgi:hypothetical protein
MGSKGRRETGLPFLLRVCRQDTRNNPRAAFKEPSHVAGHPDPGLARGK